MPANEQTENVLLSDIIATTLKNRGPLMARELETMNALSEALYGDVIPWHERPLLERTKIRLGIYRDRVQDAWAVLRGRAEIGYD